MKRQKLSVYSMILLIVTVMVGAAEILQEKEIIFPEITAIAVGTLLAPKPAWRTNRIRILICIMICAVLGVLIVIYIPLALWIKITLAYGVSEIVFLGSGTTFAPMISAIVLPVLLGTDSPVYLAAAFLLTILILACHIILVRIGTKPDFEFAPVRPSMQDKTDALVRLIIVAFLAYLALTFNARFVIAPPLLVAFTEFSKRESSARKRPYTVVAAITLCALAGSTCRYLINITLGLPLTLSAMAAATLMIIILTGLRAYVPPAGALCILPMLIPAEQVIFYPLQIFIGSSIAMGLSILIFRNKEQLLKH